MRYEIVFDPKAVDDIKRLRADLRAGVRDAIAGFLGESLPADVRFVCKVGMTTKARHEVAFIESKDGKVAYILAVFGADPTYSQNSEILPAISRRLYPDV